MGCCVSSQLSKPPITSHSHHTHHKPLSIATTDKVIIIHTTENKIHQHKQPIQAKNILSQFPNSFLCSSEAMSIGSCMPQVPDEEELQLGQIYFLMPLSKSNNKPVFLHDLCSLAVMASSVMGISSATAAEFSTGKSRNRKQKDVGSRFVIG